MSDSKEKEYSKFKWLVTGTIASILLALILTPLLWYRYSATAETVKRNTCINHLQQIGAAKYEWFLKNHKSTNDIPTPAEVAAYLKGNKFPMCPDGGKYNIGRVDEDSKCSIPRHKLPTP